MRRRYRYTRCGGAVVWVGCRLQDRSLVGSCRVCGGVVVATRVIKNPQRVVRCRRVTSVNVEKKQHGSTRQQAQRA